MSIASLRQVIRQLLLVLLALPLLYLFGQSQHIEPREGRIEIRDIVVFIVSVEYE